MIPKHLLDKVIEKPTFEQSSQGQRTNGPLHRGVSLEIEGVGKISVDWFSTKSENKNVALLLLELLLLEAKII